MVHVDILNMKLIIINIVLMAQCQFGITCRRYMILQWITAKVTQCEVLRTTSRVIVYNSIVYKIILHYKHLSDIWKLWHFIIFMQSSIFHLWNWGEEKEIQNA